MTDERYLGSRNAFEVAAFDTRFYKPSQIFERRDGPESTTSGLGDKDQKADSQIAQPDIVLSAEMTPADELEFEDWYKKEHLRDGSMIRGWRRTERYELEDAVRNAEVPKYLTLVSLPADAVSCETLNVSVVCRRGRHLGPRHGKGRLERVEQEDDEHDEEVARDGVPEGLSSPSEAVSTSESMVIAGVTEDHLGAGASGPCDKTVRTISCS